MKLMMTWLVGVPLVIATMVFLRFNADNMGSGAGAAGSVGENRHVVAAAIASTR